MNQKLAKNLSQRDESKVSYEPVRERDESRLRNREREMNQKIAKN